MAENTRERRTMPAEKRMAVRLFVTWLLCFVVACWFNVAMTYQFDTAEVVNTDYQMTAASVTEHLVGSVLLTFFISLLLFGLVSGLVEWVLELRSKR